VRWVPAQVGDEPEVVEPQFFACNTDDFIYDDDGLLVEVDTSNWDGQQVRDLLDFLGEHEGDWQGIPVPLGDDMPVVVQPRHPMAEFFATTPGYRHECSATVVRDDERVVNRWLDRRRNREVYVFDTAGRYHAKVVPLSPDRSMERLTYWLSTIGGSDAWNLEAEHKAREQLREVLTERQWRHYDLTGTFLEYSKRSRITYVFRRLRPTVAMSPRGPEGRDNETMRCLAVLCLHPIGYYANSWAGCMVPTDDVMAHLLMMRGDEAMFWGKAIQHQPHEPEAGL
jgi:hypothetical protein